MQKLVEYFVKNKLLVNIIVISVVMFGIYCVLHLQQDLMPQADLNLMRVTVTYPGASPQYDFTQCDDHGTRHARG